MLPCWALQNSPYGTFAVTRSCHFSASVAIRRKPDAMMNRYYDALDADRRRLHDIEPAITFGENVQG